MWPLARYPQVVLAVEKADHVDVWQVLNAQHDMPACKSQAPKGLTEAGADLARGGEGNAVSCSHSRRQVAKMPPHSPV